MNIKYIIPLCALLMTACSNEDGPAAQSDDPIVLGVKGIGTESTRTAIDMWDDTPVSVAYAEGSEFLTKSFNVTVSAAAGQHINTGMPYPSGNEQIHFVGYHPTAVPDQVSGIVTYDISKGDVDLMVSNKITGSYNSTFSAANPLVFTHKLTRITFRMIVGPGSSSYPEPVNGVVVRAAGGTMLNVSAKLDLNTQAVTFYNAGTVYAVDPIGQSVPTVEPMILDVMVQPDVPISFSVQTLSQERAIENPTDPGQILYKLNTAGGDAGMQYVITLHFSGVGISYQSITAVNWNTGQALSSGNTWW